MDFKKLTEKVFSFYADKKYREALKVILSSAEDLPDKHHKLNYWAACLHLKLNEPDKAIDTLKSTQERGVWWSPDLLKEDPDLAPLREEEEFKELLNRCSELREEKQLLSKPELHIITPEDYKKDKAYPLLINLHGRNGNIAEFSSHWEIPYLREIFSWPFPNPHRFLGWIVIAGTIST